MSVYREAAEMPKEEEKVEKSEPVRTAFRKVWTWKYFPGTTLLTVIFSGLTWNAVRTGDPELLIFCSGMVAFVAAVVWQLTRWFGTL